jgi:hypothetical protein
LLIVIFHTIRDGSVYREQGGDDFFDRLHPKRTTRRLVRRLERLGFDVALTPLGPLIVPHTKSIANADSYPGEFSKDRLGNTLSQHRRYQNCLNQAHLHISRLA